MEKLRAIFVKIQNISCNLIALCMVLMMSVIFIQTMTRYVVFYSIPWSEELSRYLYVTLTLMGVNIAISRRQLVRIDIIDNYLKGVALKRLNIIRAVLTLVICIIFFYSSFGMIDVSQYQTSPAMGISMQIMYSILGLGFLMSSIASLFELYDAFNSENKE
ncbi:2,3-diketo-L-gulonate TRAP transporter small permease protein YiaM [Anaerobiospirillum thomasii]|uniref:TRAP transporter small permease n=1 Tax=Anaerobiospirillum thomasii TaxID=179995 RepID=UPI000DA1079A|nr:TRAP transporter small permease [Anaerobiospirillum thomasii]SPT67836.1 2,3-diketo-L-gulonate TRAP transporter small permease protein YiaM [Anaerobiospirillum thomasii]